MDIDLSYTWDALPRLMQGAAVTLEVSIAAMVLGLLLATALTVFRESGNSAVRASLRLYIGYIRGTPFLVQVLFVYYGLPELGVRLSPLSAAILALGCSNAAYSTEIIRGGLAAVPPGETEAALALGLRQTQR